MRHLFAAAALGLGLIGPAMAAPPAASPAIPGYVRMAINDPARVAQGPTDARRHPAELIAFSGARPGSRIAELIPGNGYFTRLFSKVAGPSGHVYAVWPDEYDRVSHPNSDQMRALGNEPGYRNISVLVQPARAFAAPEPLDLVFISQNYHDYPDPFMGPTDPMLFNRAVYKALKPGGVLLVVDHAAQAGSGLRDTDTLHRIDPAVVKAQVQAAGFVYAGKIDVLRNRADDHRKKVFDPLVRGRTDQFVFKFVKPAGRR